MKRNNKALYEQIMRNVSKQVKRALNEWNIEDIKDEFDSDDNFTDNPDITQVYECPKGWKAIDGCFILDGVNRFKDNRRIANRYRDNWTELPINWTTQYSLLEKNPYENPSKTNPNRAAISAIYYSYNYVPLLPFIAKRYWGHSLFPLDDKEFEIIENIVKENLVDACQVEIKECRDNYIRNYNNLPENIKRLAAKYGNVDESSRLFLSMYKQSKENIVFLYIINPGSWDGKFIITHINNI